MDNAAKDLERTLAEWVDPYLGAPLGKAVKSVELEGGRARARIVLGFPAAGYATELESALGAALAGVHEAAHEGAGGEDEGAGVETPPRAVQTLRLRPG